MRVWIVTRYVEWENTSILGVFGTPEDAFDAAQKAAIYQLGLYDGDPIKTLDVETDTVTYSVRDHHFTAEPWDVEEG